MESKSLIIYSILSICLLSSCTTTSPDNVVASEDRELYTETYNEMGYPQPDYKNKVRKLTEEEKIALDKRMRVKKYEQSLRPVEREQYYNYQNFLPTDQDKIDFFSLPTVAARDRFADQKGFYYKSNTLSPSEKEAVQRKDIVVGMSKASVVMSWGDPEEVEVAGSENKGNERWKYIEYNASLDGYKKEQRYIIFEGGKVVGWQRY